MNTFEALEQEAYDGSVKVHKYYLGEENLKGIYMNSNVAINTSVHTTAEKSCVLAEELGHHHTSVGVIVDFSDAQNRKQERQARLWAYNNRIGLYGLIKAYEQGCKDKYEIAEHLDVTVDFLEDAIACYREKYGVYTFVDNYIVYFIPQLVISKKYE